LIVTQLHLEIIYFPWAWLLVLLFRLNQIYTWFSG